MGNGTYLGGSTIVDPQRKARTRRADPNKVFKEHLDELRNLLSYMQANRNFGKENIERIKSLLRLVTLNPYNTNITSSLLDADNYFVQSVIDFLGSIGHQPPKVWTFEKAIEYQEKTKTEIVKQQKQNHGKTSEIDEIEAKYKTEAMRISRTQLGKTIELMKLKAKTDQSIRFKLTIFQEVYRNSSPHHH